MTPEQLAKSGSEHAEQMALFQWCALSGQPLLRLLFAINNAVGRSSVIHGARNKAEGVKKGVPDLFLPVSVPTRGLTSDCLHGLFIEMKRRTASRLGEEQKEWIANLRAQGYRVEVCYGWEEARDVLIDYLK